MYKRQIVDGFKGIVIIDPDEETLREYEKKQQDEKKMCIRDSSCCIPCTCIKSRASGYAWIS